MHQDARRLLMELEQRRREINRERINPEIQTLTLDDIEPVITVAADARAAYMHTLFHIGTSIGEHPNADDIQALKQKREAFEELVSAVNAMEAMIERGYLDVVPSSPRDAA